jgi:hypothetical protein
MKLAPNDPDGVHARRFLQAWQNSFGTPRREVAPGIHEMYLRSERDEIDRINAASIAKRRTDLERRERLLRENNFVDGTRVMPPAVSPERLALPPPPQALDDPTARFQWQLATAGAIGIGIGMLALIAATAWLWLS